MKILGFVGDKTRIRKRGEASKKLIAGELIEEEGGRRINLSLWKGKG